MGRKLRVFIENVSQHIMLSGLNNMDIFIDNEDCEIFESMIFSSLDSSKMKIHNFCITPKSFNFLATSTTEDSATKFIQSLARKYVAYFNKKYARSGTIWDGRFKSSIVEDEKVFSVIAYLDQKSSMYGCEHYRRVSFVTPHMMYKNLGFTDTQREAKYKDEVSKIDNIELQFVEHCLSKQIPTASPEFVRKLEKSIGMIFAQGQRGRPKKQNTERKKMYKNLQVLDKEKHKNLKINPMTDLLFAKNLSSVALNANEVIAVGASFPVVFGSESAPSIMGVFSITNENLAINNEGKWITNYVPMAIRKYPFALGSTQENPENKVILIDEESVLFSKTKGKGLFNSKGEQSEALDNAVKFLVSYEQQAQVSKNIAKLISDSGILEDREISVGEGDEKKVLVNGFRIVNRDKLNALSDDILADWVRKGIITLIDAHLRSLDNIKILFSLIQQKQK